MKLVIAEKPSVARELAGVVGAKKKENGFYSGTDYLVSWCVGHLIETVMPEAYDEKYGKWNIADLPIEPETWKYEIVSSTKSQYQIIKNLMERADVEELVCATDAGREGELIFRLVYNQAGCEKPFRRLWISSMESKAIREGFEKLKDGTEYDRLYDAALARMQADWLVGINFSRLFGCLSRKSLNVGRVQTPTINLIVERQKAIDTFDSKPYYILTADCHGFSAAKRVESEAESKAILEKCDGKNARVASLTKAPVKENPQALYDLTTLQRDANKMLGLSAQQTLDATQNLYEKKLVTYPRTDSRYLTADMKESTAEILTALLSASYLKEETGAVYDLNLTDVSRLVNDKKVTDHHAIIPTMEAARVKVKLSHDEGSVFLLIVYRLLTAAYAPHEYIKTEILLDIEGEEFKASGRQITAQGYKEIQSHLAELIRDRAKKKKKKKAEKEEEILPLLVQDQIIEAVKLTSKENSTSPPKPYTEDTLLSAMENAMKTLEDEALKKEVAGAGLGTPATRAGIIEKIIKTEFISRKGKNLLPTEKAYALVEQVPEKVKSALLTAEWEQKLEQIYKGEISAGIFMEEIQHFVEELVAHYQQRVDENGREIIGKCPRCGANIYEGKVNYYCQTGRECNFVIWKKDRFFEEKKKPLTKPMVEMFLKKGRIKATHLYSPKNDSYYDAYIFMVDTGQYVNFRLYFPPKSS